MTVWGKQNEDDKDWSCVSQEVVNTEAMMGRLCRGELLCVLRAAEAGGHTHSSKHV